MKKILNKKGFTLIELMIVVAIIGILAAIAIPNFIRYQLKSKTTEAKTVLGGIKTSQESFRAEMDNYGAVVTVQPAGLPGTIKTDWGADPCPATCDRNTPVDCNVFDCIGYSPSGAVYYQYVSPNIEAAATVVAEFAAGAQADLDGDTEIGGYAYQSSNNATDAPNVGQVADGMTTCAVGIPAGFVQDCRPGVY